MKLNLSCADFSFPLLEHERALAIIALLGLRGVDIGLFEGHGHLKPSRELLKPVRNGAALKKKLAMHGLKAVDMFLQIHEGFIEFAINHPEAKRRRFAREHFLRALDYACAAGSKHATILPGVAFESESRRTSVARSADGSWRGASHKQSARKASVSRRAAHGFVEIDTPERAGFGEARAGTQVSLWIMRISRAREFPTRASSRWRNSPPICTRARRGAGGCKVR